MNIWVSTGEFEYNDSNAKTFPMLYFWFKDHYYQRSPDNFTKTNWFWHEDINATYYDDPSVGIKLADNPPDVFLVSLYLWNETVLLENARYVKEHYPNCIVVAGGPSAESSIKWFDANPYIDIVVVGPGHEITRHLLDNIFDDCIHDTPGIAYHNQEKIIRNAPIDRKENLLLINHVNNFPDEVKSVCNDMISQGHSILWPSILIQGCPYTCSFCEQGTELWAKLQRRPVQHLLDEIDFLTDYSPVQIRYFDSNIGIVKEYEDVYEYVVDRKNTLNWDVTLTGVDYAKNNIDRTMYLQKLAAENGLTGLTGMIALQDTDLEVLKLNGRPGDKDFLKIDAYAKMLKEVTGRPNPRVDIILGMPGQSFASLTETMITLVNKEIIESMAPPNMFYVLPNTRMTSGNEFTHIKTNRIKRRSPGSGTNWIDPVTPTNPYNTGQETIIETETLSTRELITMWYLFPAFGFMQYIQYLDTAQYYLKNFYDIDYEVLYRAIIAKFEPSNHANLPPNIQQDLQALEDLLLGKTEYLERRDKDNFGYISFDRLTLYRFIADQQEWISIINDVLVELTEFSDQRIEDIVQWMRCRTISLDVSYPRSIVSVNWDDVAQQKDTVYYQSTFTFDFGVRQTKELSEKIRDNTPIRYLPTFFVDQIDNPSSILIEDILR